MKKESKKSYFAIIPADVRYDDTLPAGAKLLYGEITALCSEKGFCWASNNYFAKLYNKDKGTISRWINKLIDHGFIKTEVDQEKGNQRKLYLSQIKNSPICKNDNTYRQKCLYPIGKNAKTLSAKTTIPIGKNANHNNTDNTTLNITDNKGNPSKKDLSSKEHQAFSLLVCYGVDPKKANSLIFDQHTPLESVENVIKNGLAKEDDAKKTGKAFVLEPGYIVQALNQARKEGKVVSATKLSRELGARLARRSKKHEPPTKADFEKSRRRNLAALGFSK